MMAKDYGNRRAARRNRGPHQFLVVIVTFLFGYITASFLDVQTISQWVNTQVLAQHDDEKAPTKVVQEHKQVPPKPKFEFYTLLANERGPASQASSQQNIDNHAADKTSTPIQKTANTVTVAVNNSVKSTITNPTPQTPVKVAEAKPTTMQQPNKGAYLVQVASFKARQDAEQMKGMLILKGFDVSVVPVTQAQGNWFRVVVGPYPNKALAQKAQMNLAKTEHLNGMVRSVGG
ncbi:TPA: SPOR domain-containing protein [Legionella pneumophila subsp. pneumophila]|nr:Sporulation domain protein [Legionella pneumophila subsp. pneumophila]HAT8702236.1 SPOR domain-containing protein [Legionella pneumophila]HAT9354376.1 SPOR domain-containing protein [Legionella pneumophila subsp. pneumophila]HAT9369637.1 SPOR domain-containing protein [Legionella pneumophila subsp. pneumophila]HAT9694012.1 SPOR domain-containing protein [Legionella pneumophila subsp. pneumophila]